MISEVGSRIYIARISDFDFLSVSFDFLYEIPLSAIAIDNIGIFRTIFTTLGALEIRRFLGTDM